jgi:hypothetical protein
MAIGRGRIAKIVKQAVAAERIAAEPELDLAEAIRRRFLPFGGVENLEPLPREPVRFPPDVD